MTAMLKIDTALTDSSALAVVSGTVRASRSDTPDKPDDHCGLKKFNKFYPNVNVQIRVLFYLPRAAITERHRRTWRR